MGTSTSYCPQLRPLAQPCLSRATTAQRVQFADVGPSHTAQSSLQATQRLRLAGSPPTVSALTSPTYVPTGQPVSEHRLSATIQLPSHTLQSAGLGPAPSWVSGVVRMRPRRLGLAHRCSRRAGIPNGTPCKSHRRQNALHHSFPRIGPRAAPPGIGRSRRAVAQSSYGPYRRTRDGTADTREQARRRTGRRGTGYSQPALVRCTQPADRTTASTAGTASRRWPTCPVGSSART